MIHVNVIRLSGRFLTYLGLFICSIAFVLAAIANFTTLIGAEWWIRWLAFIGVSVFISGGCVTVVYALVTKTE